MAGGDPYSILEVGREATEAEIKAAYRRLAATYHPDRNPGFQDAATEKLKELNAAYESIRSANREASAGAAESRSDDSGANGDHGHGGEADHDPVGRSDQDGAGVPTGGEGSEEFEHRSTIAAALAEIRRPGIDDRESVTVDILAAMIPGGATISLCVPYESFGVSGPYDFEEMHRELVQIAAAAGASAMPSLDAPALSALRGEVVLCTEEAIVWTTRQITPTDPVWEEVRVSAYALNFADVLGSRMSGRRKGSVEVWIDEGPTLTFRTGHSADAERLATHIDGIAASL